MVAPLKSARLGIVADLFHMALEEEDIPEAILQNGRYLGHVHLADSNRRLPGQGATDFRAALTALRQVGFEGWLSFECGAPGQNQDRATTYLSELPASIRTVLGEG